MSAKTSKKIVMSYVEEVMARLEGDNDKAIASKNSRKAISAVKGQCNALEGRKVDLEVELEEAQEALGNVLYPTILIGSSTSYTQSIKNAQETVDCKQQALDDVEESLEYFSGLLNKFTA